jgi:Chaperone of endosialidase
MGKLGVTTSSARFKEAIKPLATDSEGIFALKPVSFRYKEEIDPDRSPQFGLIAEEVEKADPRLVGRDEEGKVNIVRYEAVNAMLLNEFLKEHRMVQQQQATINELKSRVATIELAAQQQKELEVTVAQQQKRIENLTTELQKVSAWVQVSKAGANLASSNR